MVNQLTKHKQLSGDIYYTYYTGFFKKFNCPAFELWLDELHGIEFRLKDFFNYDM